MDGNKNHVEEEDNLSFDELNDLEGDEIFSKFMSQSPVDFTELEQYTDDEMSTILRQEMDDSIVMPIPRMSLTPSTMELSTDIKEPQNKQSISTLEESAIPNPRPSKRQEMDNSIVVPIPRTLLTSSTMELSTDLKNPRKKQSISAMEESAIPNPRRSKRIMLRSASGTKSENMKKVEEFLLEEKARKSSRASSRARVAESAFFEKETIDLSDENTDLEELHETMGNHVYSHHARNEEIMMGIRWLRMMASNATTANSHFPFNPGNSVDLLPNLQGREHSAEMLSGFAGASSSSAQGDDVLPRCTADNNHSLDDSLGNNGLAKGSGKPADLAPTD